MIFVLSLLVVLSILITVHELGHFLAAKAVGIAVPRFSLGFGKRLWGFRWGETDFVVSAIPLGTTLFADRLYFTPAGHSSFGGYAFDRLKDRW